jgi:iodotyrosine deiodinase
MIPLSFTEYPPQEMIERAEEFYALMDKRRSVRFFSDKEVPKSLIELAIQSAGTAPSGAHGQPWKFVAISNQAVKQQIRIAAEQEEFESYNGRMSQEWLDALAPIGTDWQKPFLETVPWIVVCFAELYAVDDLGEKHKHYYVQESVGIACGFFIAALHQMGLATLTHTPSPMKFLNQILGRPQNERPYILFPIGYPAENATVPDLKRKELSKISVWI